MITKYSRREDFHENSTETRESNYQEKLNSREFMRVKNIADYFSGTLGCNVSLTDADFNSIKWKYLPLTFLSNLLCYPFLIVKFCNEFNRDIYAAFRVIPNIVTGGTTFVQRFRMSYLEMELKEIYENMFKCWDNELKNGINDKIVKNARKHIFFSKLYGTFMVATLISYLIPPLSPLLTYYVFNGNETFTRTNILPVEYPFAIDTMWKWALLNFWEGSSAANSVMLLIGNDLAFVQTCALLSLQLQAVGDKLQNIVEKNDDRLLEERLLGLGKKHCELIEMCRKIEDAFNPGIFAIMIGASITLCTAAIGAEKELSRNDFGAAATTLLHFSGVILQTSVYCNTAHDITDQLEKISQRIYESQWFGHSKKFQKMTIIIMLRSNIPFKFNTYGLYNVDRIQLTKIIALTYNLIVALRNIRSFRTA